MQEIEGIEKRRGKWMCRVKWKGYPEDENTWEPLSNMEQSWKLVKEHIDNHPRADANLITALREWLKKLGGEAAEAGKGTDLDVLHMREVVQRDYAYPPSDSWHWKVHRVVVQPHEDQVQKLEGMSPTDLGQWIIEPELHQISQSL